MSLRVDLLAGAEADLQTIFNRLESHADGLGVELLTVVDAYLERITVFPEIAPIYCDNIRRQVMQGFPYGIFYERHPTRIMVVAILDLRQDPKAIRRRLKS
ncbi:MAG TPA: type II toxin-antitoxin system RelE/ParE family toxin [Verrucomicrobiae bacterium]|jgi:hypothetical protein